MAIGDSPVETLLPPVENDNSRRDKLVTGTFKCQKMAYLNAPKNGRNFTCNLAGNSAITYSGKATPQLKVPNSSNIEDTGTG